ncbi:VacJ family lipoprotein [Ponticaulis sp.]|uniref:MlaA family lipoprotein n=1 Tax=Ponticaulis sp. TaxID=2020902 RepID=UPI000B71524B|nr:VacJ family lipoprotein [Ponticaulis sp.]MAI89182.1 VacJ family lipoprotein [Ponticaulis sp.]OUY01176.1 MAG: VacJ family lipoprotein [Hyphomonadaceae bacterium TMED5]|tara:strand:- start:85387 stop:86124 length:738 start_codon:yes stop_codon:yes gene_type:complete
MKIFSVLALALSVAACATSPGQTSREDPYEDFNRSMLEFNLAVDDAVLEPASQAYTAVTPRWGRDRVADFFGNLGEPVTFVNDVLQGEPDRAAETGIRFVVNSTVGLAGIFDVMRFGGMEGHDEDFGQTLAVWGVDSGPYLVMPLLGSTNPRDLVGFGVDRAMSPTNYVVYSGDDDEDLAIRSGMVILNGLNARSRAQTAIETLREQPEPYIALRRTYTSQRDAEIRNGQTDPNAYQDLPDFDDF